MRVEKSPRGLGWALDVCAVSRVACRVLERPTRRAPPEEADLNEISLSFHPRGAGISKTSFGSPGGSNRRPSFVSLKHAEFDVLLLSCKFDSMSFDEYLVRVFFLKMS